MAPGSWLVTVLCILIVAILAPWLYFFQHQAVFHSCWKRHLVLEQNLCRTRIYRNLPDTASGCGKDSGKGEAEGSWGDILLKLL